MRSNHALGRRLFSVFSGEAPPAGPSAAAAVNLAADEAPASDAAAAADRTAEATAAAAEAVTAAATPLQARAALGALWQQHHCPRLAALQRSLRTERPQPTAPWPTDASADAAAGLHQKALLEALQQVQGFYRSLYKKFRWRASQETLQEAKSLRAAGTGESATVAAAATKETDMWGEAEERLLEADAAVEACEKGASTMHSHRFCMRHILAQIKVILADLSGYRERLEVESITGFLEQEQQQEVLLLLRPPLPGIPGTLQRTCLLYGEALRLFPMDAAASTQLFLVYFRIFGTLQRRLQQVAMQKQLPSRKDPLEASGADDSPAGRADAVAASFAAASVYWAFRAAIGQVEPFAGGNQDELTLLLQRLSATDFGLPQVRSQPLMAQQQQQQLAATLRRTAGGFAQQKQLLQSQTLLQQQHRQQQQALETLQADQQQHLCHMQRWQEDLHRQQTEATNARWEQLSSELYGKITEGLLDMLQRQEEQERQKRLSEQQQEQPELLQLRKLRHGTPQMQAALEICCRIAETYVAAARTALLRCLDGAVPAAGAANFVEACCSPDKENSQTVQRTTSLGGFSGTGSKSESAWGDWIIAKGSSSTEAAFVAALLSPLQALLLLFQSFPDLDRADTPCISVLRKSLCSLLPLLFKCKVVSREQWEQEQQGSVSSRTDLSATASSQEEVSSKGLSAKGPRSMLEDDGDHLLLLRAPLIVCSSQSTPSEKSQKVALKTSSLASASAVQAELSPETVSGAAAVRGAAIDASVDSRSRAASPQSPPEASSVSFFPCAAIQPVGNSSVSSFGAIPAATSLTNSPKIAPSGVYVQASGEKTAQSVSAEAFEEVEIRLESVTVAGGAMDAAAAEHLWGHHPSLAATRAARLLLLLLDSDEARQVLQEEQKKLQVQAAAQRLQDASEKAAATFFARQQAEDAELLQLHDDRWQASLQRSQQPQLYQQLSSRGRAHARGNWGALKGPSNHRGFRGFVHSGGGLRGRRGGYGGSCVVSRPTQEGGGLPRWMVSESGASGDGDTEGSSLRQSEGRWNAVALEWGSHPRAPEGDRDYLVVIDGSNVAMRHGDTVKREREGGKLFSTQGILSVLAYYKDRGYKVRVFVPDYVLSYSSVAEARRQERAQLPVNQARLPDSVEALKKLQREGTLISTPPQDYDDSYCIKYALMNNGCIVTNDLYRDITNRVPNKSQQTALRAWLKRHVISFTFVDGEFLPNPEFQWPPVDDPAPTNISWEAQPVAVQQASGSRGGLHSPSRPGGLGT
ncbi:ribonuclease related [Cyclospora cayetanensis]|uniref:Ribonuclease related n=1 Tax=Cyclospora cayetanensis TaxID=88456 RepID=A0A1D3CRA3_9EIME|nr:ribonuclease related [Cyclospora cayetanensis]